MPLKARPSQMEAFNPTPTTNRSHRGGYGFPSHDQARKSLSTARSPIRGILLLHPDSAYYAHFNIRPDKFCFCGHLVPLDPFHITEDYGPSFWKFPDTTHCPTRLNKKATSRRQSSCSLPEPSHSTDDRTRPPRSRHACHDLLI